MSDPSSTEIPSTKLRLLDAAAEVFLEFGFASASLDTVRQRAGVSNGSLYHHYPTKTHLADALYAHILRDYHSQMMDTLAHNPPAKPGVKGLISTTVQWVLHNPKRARLLHDLRIAGALTGGPRERDETNAKAFGALAIWVTTHTDTGEMRAMPQPIWTALVFSPVMALIPYWVSETQPAANPTARPTVNPSVIKALEHAAWMAVAA